MMTDNNNNRGRFEYRGASTLANLAEVFTAVASLFINGRKEDLQKPLPKSVQSTSGNDLEGKTQ